MKIMHHQKRIIVFIGLLLFATLLLGGCTNVNPVEPQPAPPTPSTPTNPATPTTPTIPTKPPGNNLQDVKVIYNYSDQDKVHLSANNIMLKVGQRLILQPAPGLTRNTRFTSSGEHFFGDVLKQETGGPDSGKVIFTAIKPGKGKLTIIPNTTETDRASDLWVTVQ
jgi:hypothetical protein